MAQLDWYIRANLKLRQLQLLVAMDDYRQVSKIADLLNVTQPAISKSLKELQEGVRTKLFERNGRHLQPTYAGECLIRHARIILGQLHEAGDELQGILTGHVGKLRIGALPAAASALLPQALMRLKKQVPAATVFVRESTMDLMLPELRTGHIDVILGTLLSRQDGRDLQEKVIYDDPTVLVVGEQHPLARRKKVDWPELASHSWILPPAGSLLREPLLAAFYAHELELPAGAIETLSINVILNHTQMSDCIATLPETVARRYSQLGMLAILPVPLDRLVRPVGLTWLKGRTLPPLMQNFFTCLEKAAKAQVS